MRPKLATTLTRLVAVATAAALFAGVAPALASAKEQPLDRKNVIRRAKTWTSTTVRYSQTGYRDGYRRDCSGFISMAWSLPENLVTWRIPLVAKRIGKSDLRPGDVLLNYTAKGGAKHAIIFESWANSKKTAYIGLEQTGASGVDKAVRRKIPYPYFNRQGQYKPWRYTGMDGYWKSIPQRDRQPVRGYAGPIKSPEKLKAEAKARAVAAAKKQAAEKAAAQKAAVATQKAAAEALKLSQARQAAKVAARAQVQPVTGSPKKAPAESSGALNAAVVKAGLKGDAMIVKLLESLSIASTPPVP